MDIGNDIAQIFFQQHEILFSGKIFLLVPAVPILRWSFWASLVQSADHIIDLLLACLDTSHNLTRLDALKGEDFVKFSLQFCNKCLFVILGPRPSFWMGLLWSRLRFIWRLEGILEVVIRDIIIIVVFEKRCSQLLAKARSCCQLIPMIRLFDGQFGYWWRRGWWEPTA